MKRIFFVLLFLFPVAANATIAATTEELLCHSSDIVMAKVTKATPPPCGRYVMSTIDCEKSPYVPLTIEVTKIIARYAGNPNFAPLEGLAIGSPIKVTVSANNRIPVIIGGITTHGPIDYGSINIEPPTDKVVTQEQLEETFVGKEFIFAVVNQPGDPHESPHSFIWMPRRAAWVQDTLQQAASFNVEPPACPKLVQE